MDCSSLGTSLFEAANPDSALPGASWLRDLRNLRLTEYADLGNPPTESERLDACQHPDGRKPQESGRPFPPSPDPDVVPAPPTPDSQFPPYLARNLVSPPPRVIVVRLRDNSGWFLPRSDSHQSAHDEPENSSRKRTEPGSSSRDGQPIRVDAPDHAVIPGDVENVRGKNSRLERMTRIPIFNVFQINLLKKILLLNHSRPNPLSHDCHIHEDESLLNSLRETCARDSHRRAFLLFPPVKLLWHSVRIAWNLLVCRTNDGKKVGVEVRYPVTADMFENPEHDWFATASSRARARVEVNIKRLSVDERAQFRAAQHIGNGSVG